MSRIYLVIKDNYKIERGAILIEKAFLSSSAANKYAVENEYLFVQPIDTIGDSMISGSVYIVAEDLFFGSDRDDIRSVISAHTDRDSAASAIVAIYDRNDGTVLRTVRVEVK